MTLDLLEFVIVTDFTPCADFGSYAFVYPVIRHLSPEHHLNVERGLLKTFDRLMPALMTLCPVLSISLCDSIECSGGVASTICWLAAIVFAGALDLDCVRT